MPGPETASFLKELSGRLRQVSGDEDSHHHLLQRLSVAVQRGNAASVLGSAGSLDSTDLFGHWGHLSITNCYSLLTLVFLLVIVFI